MGRLAIRNVNYFGTHYDFTSPKLMDGLVIIEGNNGSGKTTFSDLIYFGLGGTVKKFSKKGTEQHKQIRDDSDNGVLLVLEINGELFSLTRRFTTPEDVVVDWSSGKVEVFPVVRRDGRRILSDWMLETLGIDVVTLFFGTYHGKLNFTDIMRLIYHDQDLDPSRVFKKSDNENFVSDSREFRHAIFEILIGKASEEYYKIVGELKIAQMTYADRTAALSAYASAITQSTEHAVNANFLNKAIVEHEQQIERLEQTRAILRQQSPNAPARDTDLLSLRQQLAATEVEVTDTEQRIETIRSEKIRLRMLAQQLTDDIIRIQKIIHTHETLALFSPDTCPCCLRKVDRPSGNCICGQPIDESAYQRFFYSADEYASILKSKQKNIETVRSAIDACERKLAAAIRLMQSKEKLASDHRKSMQRWAGIGGAYSTELEAVDDKLVSVRVKLERLREQITFELARDKYQAQVDAARREVERLQQEAKVLEIKAQRERAEKITQFEVVYTALMRETLSDVHFARLNSDYEPVINDAEYREASASVTRRLMYYVTLLQMSLTDAEIAFPRFLLIDTPETAGIDRENLSRAIGKIADVISGSKVPAQVLLTTGPDRYPDALRSNRLIVISEDKLLTKRPDADSADAVQSETGALNANTSELDSAGLQIAGEEPTSDDTTREYECSLCLGLKDDVGYSCVDCDYSGFNNDPPNCVRENDLGIIVPWYEDARGDVHPLTCEKCNSNNLDLSYPEALCSRCQNLLSKDD